MALTTFTYSVAQDTAQGEVNASQLQTEITQNNTITIGISAVNITGDVLDIIMKDSLPGGQETALDATVLAHIPTTTTTTTPLKVVIEEEDVPTNGSYQACGECVDVPASIGWHDLIDFTWPIPVNILCGLSLASAEHDGDQVEVVIAPNTTIGALTASASIGASTLTVSDSVLLYLQTGYELTLTDGTNTDYCGRVLSINTVSKIITVETATEHAFSAASPTYVKMTVKAVRCLDLIPGLKMDMGRARMGSKYLPANTIMRLRYNNNDGAAKRFGMVLEYIY